MSDCNNDANIEFCCGPEATQLWAIASSGPYAIRVFDNPTKRVQLKAVSLRGTAIQYINNPDEDVQLEAVRNKPCSIYHIKSPSDEVQLAAIEQSWKTGFYNTVLNNYTITDSEEFFRKINKMKLQYGPMGPYGEPYA